MPKMRPRTSAGSSSCSAVCDGMATKAYTTPGADRDDDDDGDEATNGREARDLVWIGEAAGETAGERLHDRKRNQRDAHRDEADVDHQPLRNRLAVRVEEEDADHRPEAGRAHDEEEVLLRQSEDLGRKAGPDRAHAPRSGMAAIPR